MHYFALFTILLSISANPSAQLYQGRPRSRLPIGRTTETCEPVYAQDRYGDYRESGNIDDHHNRNRGKKLDNSHDHDQNLSEELALEKGLPIETDSHPNLGQSKMTVDVEDIGKPAGGDVIVKKKQRTGNYNLNANVNHIETRKKKIVMKNVLEEGEKNDDEIDNDDDLNFFKPASRIFEDGKRKKVGSKPLRRFKNSSPGSKYGRSLSSHINVNTNVNQISVKKPGVKIEDEKVSSQVNSQNDQHDSNLSEKHTSVAPDAEIISEDEGLQKIEEASTTPGPQISSTSESSEIVTPAINSVTETPESSGSSDDTDNKKKKPTKRGKKRPKGRGKKKKKKKGKIPHKYRDSVSEISEQGKDHREAQIEVSTESNVESTTSIVENIQESSQPTITENTTVDEPADADESKLPVALLEKPSNGAAQNSDDEAGNVETKNDSSSADETVNSDNKTSESKSSDVETEKKEQEIQVNSSRSTNDEIEGKENGSSKAHVDEAETLDDPKITAVNRMNDGDDDDDKSEEKSSMKSHVKVEVESHEGDHLPEVTKINKNVNVNTNVNGLSSELGVFKTKPRRLKRIDPENSEKKDRLDSASGNNADLNKNDAIVPNNRRSARRLSRRNNVNVNTNVNNIVNAKIASDDDEYERRGSNRRSLDDTNSTANDNVNANLNVNSIVSDRSKLKLRKKTVDKHDADNKRQKRRNQLHQRYNDTAYVEEE